MAEEGKLKLGLFIPFIAAGGAGRAVCRISELLTDEYDIYLILFDASKIDFQYKGTIIDMGLPSIQESFIKKMIRSVKRIRKLKADKKRYRLDAVISFLDIANICNILTKIRSCRVIASVRGSIYNYKADGITDALKKWILARIYRRSDRIIAVSKVLKNNLAMQFSLPETKVVPIYNPFDKERILEQADAGIDADTAEFIKGKKVVLAVGQLVFAKGFWHLLKAFKQVNENTPDTVLVICGEGASKQNIEKLAVSLSISSCVRILGFRKNIFPYMKASDVFVLPSITEGFPNVLVEAMINGLPVIAVDCISGPREILISEPDLTGEASGIQMADFGILTPRMTPEENWDAAHIEDCEKYFAEAVETLLKDEALRAHYSGMAKERACVFDNETCKRAYKQVVDEAVLCREKP